MQPCHLATAGGDLKVWETASFAQLHSVSTVGTAVLRIRDIFDPYL